MGNGAREYEWRHAPEACGGFCGFWKSQLVELRTRHQTSKVDFRGSQTPDEFARYGCRTRWGADGKAIIERLCISLPCVETFNSKVIKGFVPELRSRYVFFVFRDSYVLCIYVLNILCTFHTYPYHGYGTIREIMFNKIELGKSNAKLFGLWFFMQYQPFLVI